jgi:hypothetical protein
MENRNGLVVDVETTEANGRAERQAAENVNQRRILTRDQRGILTGL